MLLFQNECELMVHRRTFIDDRFGVGEALDEHAYGKPLVARGKHYIYIGQHEEGKNSCRSFTKKHYPLNIQYIYNYKYF